MKQWIRANYKGLLLSVLIGVSAHFIGRFSTINGVMLGLLTGIVLGNIIPFSGSFNNGISFSSSKLLEFSIVLMAFSINFNDVVALGWQNFILVVVMIISVLLITLFLAKKMNCPESTGTLVGFGTAICGSSAIAAIAPGVAKNKGDIGIALAVVNLMGSIGMVALPYVLKFIDLSETDAGVVIGATLHSVGNVAGAGYGMEKYIGDTAITIKLARVAMLSPAVILFTYLVNKKEAKSWKEHFKLPLYLWLFIAVTVFSSLISLPSIVLGGISEMGKLILTIAMVAIGLKVSFKKLFFSGRKAMGFGAVVFIVQIAIVSLLLFLF